MSLQTYIFVTPYDEISNTMKYQKIVHFFLVLILDLAGTHYLGFHRSHKTFEVSDLLRSQKPVGRVQRCSARETFGTTPVCQKVSGDTRQVVDRI